MRLLAISGSQREASTNTSLLHALARIAEPPVRVDVLAGLSHLPIFSPDLEGAATPAPVLEFACAVGAADGLIVSCPEYVRALPGGFKNAIDWLVSRDEIIGKPVALLHASHRGDDVLEDLRRVLSTVTHGFMPDVFAQFHLVKMTPDEVARHMAEPERDAVLRDFLGRFVQRIAAL